MSPTPEIYIYKKEKHFEAKMKPQKVSQLLFFHSLGVLPLLASSDQSPVPVPGSVVSYNFTKTATMRFTNSENQTERSLLRETCILTEFGFSCS